MPEDLKAKKLADLSAEEVGAIEDIVGTCSFATPFHRTDWLLAIERNFNAEIMIITGRGSSGRIELYLPMIYCRDGILRSLYSYAMRYEMVYGGPLWTSGSHALDERFFKSLRRALPARIRNIVLTLPPRFPDASREKEGIDHFYNTVLIGLEDTLERIWETLDYKKIRWGIKKARKRGITLGVDDAGAIGYYYDCMTATYERYNRAMLPLTYYRELVGLPFVKVFSAVLNGRPIAVTVVLTHRDTVYYWANASAVEHRSLCPNDFLVWEILQWAKRQGYRAFDFLITHIEAGVGRSDFKLKYGGTIVPVYEYKNPGLPGFFDRAIYYLENPGRIAARLTRGGRKGDNGQ